MAEHHASVTVNAPSHQVYALFTHFDDFPKFMRFVKEVTYHDDRRTHWVAQVGNQYEWDAVNEDWIPERQIGWRSTKGLQNTGKVKFRPIGPNTTIVDVYISYIPPTGPLGKLVDSLGVDSHFDAILREDLNHFARMVEQSPPGALDPMSSHYLFHNDSAFVKGTITNRQRTTIANDPRMSAEALAERKARIEQEAAQRRQAELERAAGRKQQEELVNKLRQEHEALEREAARRLQELRAQEAALAAMEARSRELHELHPVHDTIGGRNASRDRTAMGDQDSLRPRHPKYEQDPMTARHPKKTRVLSETAADDVKFESPWRNSIVVGYHGSVTTEPETQGQ